MPITAIWQPEDIQIMAMINAVINLTDAGMVYEN